MHSEESLTSIGFSGNPSKNLNALHPWPKGQGFSAKEDNELEANYGWDGCSRVGISDLLRHLEVFLSSIMSLLV